MAEVGEVVEKSPCEGRVKGAQEWCFLAGSDSRSERGSSPSRRYHGPSRPNGAALDMKATLTSRQPDFGGARLRPTVGHCLSVQHLIGFDKMQRYIFDNTTLASWPPYEQGGTSKTTMGSFLSSPMTEKDSTDGEIDSHRFGSSAMQGWRKGMEVRLSVVPCALYPSA